MNNTETHICSVITGEKLVLTSLPDEPGRLGWILPCEAFKSRPVLIGIHCDNVEDISIKDALENSKYFQVTKELAKIWLSSGMYREEVCFGQWLLTVTNEQGELII